jgi:NAD(P)-dependent dehydrogenase (short-subunit alcohol dehydrogenase family)
MPEDRIAAVVTGGGTGIGYACGERLARRGAGVVLCGRRMNVLAEAARRMEESATGTGRVVAVAADVTDPAGVEAAVQECVARFGRIDVLVNSAGVWREGPFLELSSEAWDEVLAVNLRGAALISACAAKRMIAQGAGGRIVHIASISGQIGEPGWAHYSSAKAGLISLTRTMAVELAEHGITTNAVAPGWIATDMTRDYFEGASPASFTRLNPLGRVGTPDEVAAVVSFLALDAPGFLTGEVINVDGGQAIMAAMPDPA